MKKRKNGYKNIILFLFMILCFGVFIFSLTKIMEWKIDSNQVKKQITEIEKVIDITEVNDTNKTEIIEQEEEIPQSNPYWDYIEMNLINVDFKDLKKTNSETVGWIQVNGTNINYPFVQTKDNEYYLTHSFNKTDNNAGWVFLDYRNHISNLDQNTIIYAHGRLDNVMFGTLKNILTNGWLNNSNNYVLKLSTENENTLWQVFSVYRIPTTNDYLQINFNNENEFKSFADKLKDRSDYNFNTNVSGSDHILTLSTCYNTSDKVVLHAKLIKKETKN